MGGPTPAAVVTGVPERPLAARLLERDAELEAVAGSLEIARSGAGLPVLIEGPPGIGKTRLLQAVREQALLDGFRVLTARATELERGFAFGPVRQLFEPVLAAAEEPDRAELLAGAARLAVPVFEPPEAPALMPADPEYGHLHGLYWLVANLAEEQPLLLAIDDVHWADAATLRFLSFLAPRLDGLALLLCVSTRPDEPGTGAALGPELAEHPDLVPIRPRSLSEGAVAGLVEERWGEDAASRLAAACHRATGGNPFLVGELMRALGERGRDPGLLDPSEVEALGSERIARSVLGRIERAGPEAVALATSVAVLGDRAELEHATELSAIPPERAGEVADALADASILQPGRPLSFVHPIMRSAVYSGLGHQERSDAHRRAAGLLTNEERTEAAAVQLLSADPVDEAWAVRCLQKAAVETLGRGEAGIARRFLERALEERPESEVRAEIVFELARAAGQAGEEDAIERLSEARELAQGSRLQTLSALELAMALHFLDRAEDSIDVARDAIESLAESDADLGLQLQAVLLIGAHHRPATREKTRSEIRSAVAAARAPDASPVVLAHAAFELAVVDGALADAAELAERAFDAGLIALVSADFPSVYACASTLSLAGHYESAERWLTDALEDARSRGSGRALAPAFAFRAWNRHWRGALAGAEADARRSEELLAGDHIIRPLALAVLAHTLLDRDRLDEAAEVIASFDPRRLRAGLFSLAPYFGARAAVELARGEPDAALAALTPVAEWEADSGYRGEAWVPHRSLQALARSELGEDERALELAEEAVALTRELGSARATGIALRAQARVGPAAAAEAILSDAVEVLASSGARLEYAGALVDLGAAIRRANRAREAREPLRDGLQLASERDATALVDRAASELGAAGARPRRPAQSGAGSLTPAERRVAELAAEGRSNREIAQALFVTRKTVETHLGRVYRKLEISSRVQLPGRLGTEA